MVTNRFVLAAGSLICLSCVVAWAGTTAEPNAASSSAPGKASALETEGPPSGHYVVEATFVSEQGKTLSAPRIFVPPGKKAVCFDHVLRPFVTSKETKNGKPHIDTVECGTRLTVLVRESQGGLVTLDATVERPDVEDVQVKNDLQALRMECPTVRIIESVKLGEELTIPFGEKKSEVRLRVTRVD